MKNCSIVTFTVACLFLVMPANAGSRPCGSLPTSAPLPLKIGPFNLNGPAGWGTLGNSYIPLGQKITISFDKNVARTQIELFTQREKATISVTIFYKKDGLPLKNDYNLTHGFGNVAFLEFTNGALRIEILGPDNDSWLVSVCEPPK
jgi:hypothetical protein